jgi:hypothetical protein
MEAKWVEQKIINQHQLLPPRCQISWVSEALQKYKRHSYLFQNIQYRIIDYIIICYFDYKHRKARQKRQCFDGNEQSIAGWFVRLDMV